MGEWESLVSLEYFVKFKPQILIWSIKIVWSKLESVSLFLSSFVHKENLGSELKLGDEHKGQGIIRYEIRLQTLSSVFILKLVLSQN